MHEFINYFTFIELKLLPEDSMLKLLSVLTFFFVVNGCSSTSKDESKQNKVTQAAKSSLNSYNIGKNQPVVLLMARADTDKLSNNEINSILRHSFACDEKTRSANNDICLLQTPQSLFSTKETSSSQWLLRKNPQLFIWNQALDKDASFSLEIQDISGMPIPTTSIIKNFPGQVIASAIPDQVLARNQKHFLVGKVKFSDQRPSQTMLKEFTISDDL